MKPVSFLILLVLLCAAVPAVSAAETYVVTATWGTNGSGDGQLHYPEDIALDAAGNVYVTDGGNQRIQKFTVGRDVRHGIGEETTWARGGHLLRALGDRGGRSGQSSTSRKQGRSAS